MPDTAPVTGFPRGGLLRRLGALIYDTLLLASVWMIGTAVLLPLTGGEAIEGVWRPLFQLYLAGLSFGFFALFWVRGGQTLGMKAWRLRVQRPDGTGLTLTDALRRFLFAIPAVLLGGIGLFWLLFDRDRLALHDRLSSTEVVLIPAR
ncbi:RDD family protein [Methylonatrum kenyense]|uniref:RDD family protein n=1 Tax=Methylonatrum kenyense TaxID=455253 RepID=UPI0020BFE2F1|nr:RDD family protein [Methylonatrum kenyense]MCK8516107.1 RDD family protein [Methylonatrum kenyense]